MAESDILVFVEERSAEEIVRAVGRRLGLAGRMTVLKHRGAGDLERSLKRKLAADPLPYGRYLILRDADNLDCQELKKKLSTMIPASKRSRTRVRLVCQELEAWYLAQSNLLVREGVLKTPIPKRALQGGVDAVRDPKRLFQRHAHQKGQIAHAQRIGPLLNLESRASPSFAHFISALRYIANLD